MPRWFQPEAFRVNNLNFLRIFFAVLVIFSHTSPLVGGLQRNDWIANRTGWQINGGNLAVYLSSGTYPYAFPIQQLLVYWFHPAHPLILFAYDTPLALLAAGASWHWVEAPWLRKKQALESPSSQGGVV